MIWKAAYCFVLSLFFFPIMVQAELVFSGKEKRLYSGVYLYGMLRVFSGFCYFSHGKLWLFRKNKATCVTAGDLVKSNKANFDLTRGFLLSEIRAVVEAGSENSPAECVFFLQAFESAFSAFSAAFRTNSRTIFHADAVYRDKEDVFSALCRLTLWFTPAALAAALVKKLLSGRKDLEKGRKKGKQTQ